MIPNLGGCSGRITELGTRHTPFLTLKTGGGDRCRAVYGVIGTREGGLLEGSREMVASGCTLYLVNLLVGITYVALVLSCLFNPNYLLVT